MQGVNTLKKYAALMLIVTSIFVASNSAHTQSNNLGYIPNWDSDANNIGRWSNTPSIFILSPGANTFQSSQLQSYLNHARTQWSNAGISTSIASSQSNANITFYGGTWAQSSLLYPGLPSNALGYAIRTDQFEGYWDHLSGFKAGYTLNSSQLGIVYQSNGTTSHYQHVATHELGHGLGWYGHAPGDTNVMSTNHSNTLTATTTVDRRHLTQIYGR